MQNEYKSYPFDIQLDWKTGNVLLNITDKQCKIELNKDTVKEIQNLFDLYEKNSAPCVRQGEIYKTSSAIVKVLDITSENYYSNSPQTTDTKTGYIKVIDVFNCEEAAFVINADHEVFLRNVKNGNYIKKKMVIYADLTDKFICFKAMPYSLFIKTFKHENLIS